MLAWRHALARISERCPDIEGLERAIELCESVYRTGSTAVRVAVLPAHRGETDADYYGRTQSNGDEVWAVIRDGYCATVMLRRSNQTQTPAAFRCDQIGYVA